jgi:hypothetical protein
MSQRIVLNSREQSIKVVNRTRTIRLQHNAKGDKGSTGYSTMVREMHGSDATRTRPNAIYVEWMGSVAPLNAAEVDTWVATPAL